ncbi:MAG: hypothetical protein A3B68_03390 [Candidatus Melainabacteria bacterium RIFCSPHIGHO2_02_FULL_34_12]|nr:MAG: hypothetical protein A3B68_03390 [Candidatus Melainabacteria bacterium RIFCSPHIGHO2_02_FULL_34_12]
MKLKNIILITFIIFMSVFSQGITITQKAYDNSNNEDEDIAVNKEPETKETNCVAKVIRVISDFEEELPGGNKQRSQQLLLKILTGHNKNKERVTLNVIPDNPAFSIIGQVNKKYIVSEIETLENGNEEYFILDYYREPYIWILSVSFLILLLIVGGFKGARTIVSLLVTVGLVAFLLIPSIVKGINPLLSAILVSFLATGITMLLVAGANFKSLAATLGTVIGVTFSGVIATLVIKFASLSGLASSEAMILWGNQVYQINFKGLLAAGMIVSCLGAIMDVAISIASSMQEIKAANLNYSFKDLFHSGMNVGKDIMGTMTNTLVLAYTGMALPLLLLISHEKNPAKYLNLELVVSEITAALAGSIGLIIAVPATALIMAWLINKRK